MSIAENLQNINDALKEAWVAVGEKGATVPASNQNLVNLINRINSIGSGASVTASAVVNSPTVTGYIEDNLEAHLKQAYTSIRNREGVVPEEKNFANLATAIRSIPTHYASLVYTDANGTSQTYLVETSADMLKLDNSTYASTASRTIELTGLTLQSDQITECHIRPRARTLKLTNFLAGCANLTTVTGSEHMQNVGNYFCASCPSLNCPLTYCHTGTLTSDLASGFLYGCTGFNSTITIPSSVIGIGDFFLQGCSTFNQPLVLPSGVRGIGMSFLSQCEAFNQPLTIPNSVTQIRSSFLYKCYSFNQPLTIPNGVTTIDQNFLESCIKFNSSLTLPAYMTTFNISFMNGCGDFNQPLTIPSSVVTIGRSFLANCIKFAQPLTIPASVTTVYGGLLSSAYQFTGPLTVPLGPEYKDDSSTLAVTSDRRDRPIYATGVTINGEGASEFKTVYPNGYHNPYYRNLK